MAGDHLQRDRSTWYTFIFESLRIWYNIISAYLVFIKNGTLVLFVPAFVEIVLLGNLSYVNVLEPSPGSYLTTGERFACA